jgi:pyruvate formate lyase activating enzyme
MTTLVVPTYVDDPEMIRRMSRWIVQELGPDYPLHFLRFFPRYRLTRLPPTPVSTLEKLRDIALEEGIRYVYIDNVPGHKAMNTYCHQCHQLLVERKGYLIPQNNIKNGKCRFCGAAIPGRWS